MSLCTRSKGGGVTLMEGDERIQGTKDLSKFALCHDVQLQHGLIIHLVARVKTMCVESGERGELRYKR